MLHEHIVLFTAVTAEVPFVGDADRLEVELWRMGFIRIVATYGFQERPDVAHALRLAAERGAPIDPEHAIFFLSHVTLVPARSGPRLSPLRRWLYVLLQRNSIPAARHFELPPDRVFEVGTPVPI